MKQKLSTALLAVVAVTLVAAPVLAHFPWLAINQEGKAILFFGENIADRTYHLPGPIAKARVNQIEEKGKPNKVELTSVDTDDFVGLVSVEAVTGGSTLASEVTYGVHQGSLLKYYTLHQGGKLPTSLAAYKNKESGLSLTAKLVDTDNGVDAYVSWHGKPLVNVEVKLYCNEGHEEGSAKTDSTGKVSFTDREVEAGLNGIIVGHTIKDEAGKQGGKAYQSAMHYLTITFVDPE